MALKLCFNCLKPGHSSKTCRRNRTCHTCGLHHHSSLCIKTSSSNSSNRESSNPSTNSNANSTVVSQGKSNQSSNSTNSSNHRSSNTTSRAQSLVSIAALRMLSVSHKAIMEKTQRISSTSCTIKATCFVSV